MVQVKRILLPILRSWFKSQAKYVISTSIKTNSIRIGGFALLTRLLYLLVFSFYINSSAYAENRYQATKNITKSLINNDYLSAAFTTKYGAINTNTTIFNCLSAEWDLGITFWEGTLIKTPSYDTRLHSLHTEIAYLGFVTQKVLQLQGFPENLIEEWIVKVEKKSSKKARVWALQPNYHKAMRKVANGYEQAFDNANQYALKSGKKIKSIQNNLECGGSGGLFFYFKIRKPGKLFTIAQGDYEWCEFRKKDPLDRNNCKQWEQRIAYTSKPDLRNDPLEDVSGVFRYLIEFDDGSISHGGPKDTSRIIDPNRDRVVVLTLD